MQVRELVAGIYAADGTLISDEHVLQFDFTSDNAREREMPRKFLLSREADNFNNQDVFLKLRRARWQNQPLSRTTQAIASS